MLCQTIRALSHVGDITINHALLAPCGAAVSSRPGW